MTALHEVRAAILAVLREGTVLHGTSLMTEEMKSEAHTMQLASNILAAVKPFIERDALDHPEERAFAEIDARLNIHADRLDAFDAKGTANINRFKDVNNAIERLERQVFGGIQPRDAEYVYPHLDDGLDKRFDEVFQPPSKPLHIAVRLVRRLDMADSLVEMFGGFEVRATKITRLDYGPHDLSHISLADGRTLTLHNDGHVLVIQEPTEGKATQ